MLASVFKPRIIHVFASCCESNLGRLASCYIDIIWIKDDKIVGVAENVMPQPGAQLWQLKSYSSPVPVNRVLEVNAGWFAKNGIKIGEEAKEAKDVAEEAEIKDIHKKYFVE